MTMFARIAPSLLGTVVLIASAALPALALAAPAKWTVNMGASKLAFASSYGGTAFNGSFGKWSADILFDPAQLPASSIKVSVDPASAQTGDSDRDSSLPEDEWVSVKKFPAATFVSTKITAAGPGRYAAAGNLTMRGVTRPATLNFTLKITGNTADATGNLVLNRSQFGVGQGQFKGGETVPLNVTVNTVIKATRAK